MNRPNSNIITIIVHHHFDTALVTQGRSDGKNPRILLHRAGRNHFQSGLYQSGLRLSGLHQSGLRKPYGQSGLHQSGLHCGNPTDCISILPSVQVFQWKLQCFPHPRRAESYLVEKLSWTEQRRSKYLRLAFLLITSLCHLYQSFATSLCLCRDRRNNSHSRNNRHSSSRSKDFANVMGLILNLGVFTFTADHCCGFSERIPLVSWLFTLFFRMVVTTLVHDVTVPQPVRGPLPVLGSL